jgi:hypothetical protein
MGCSTCKCLRECACFEASKHGRVMSDLPRALADFGRALVAAGLGLVGGLDGGRSRAYPGES